VPVLQMPAKRQSAPPKRQTRAPERDGTRAPERDGTRAPERDGFGRGHVTEIQRARMVTAMIDVVSERGRSNATVAHVVARSGVSRRTFYEVFDDFEDCFLAALDQSIAHAAEYVLGEYDPAEKWHTRIRVALTGFLEFLDAEPAMGRLCVLETLGAGVKVHERRLAALDAVIAVLDEGRRQSRAATALPPLTGEGVAGGVLSVLHARLLVPFELLPDSGTPDRARRQKGTQHPKGHTQRAHGTQAGEHHESLLELTGPLMGMIVLPYLGPAAAHRESSRAAPERRSRARTASRDPLRGLEMRLTYRTVRVLLSIAEGPGASNREVGVAAGIDDQGQISKLLSRLERLGLIENSGAGQVRGAPNAWALTKKGVEVEQLVVGQTSVGARA
jgi:AcrR family transcriptional regulator